MCRMRCFRSATFVALTCIAASTWGQATYDQELAKNQGVILYNLNRGSAAIPFLEISARAGDAESQYLMGKFERRSPIFDTDNSQYWYELAAEQDHIYAMMRLFDVKLSVCRLLKDCSSGSKDGSEWRTYAQGLAEHRSLYGDSKAMFQLYLMTGNFDWLVRSADAGFPEGQHWLAIQYRQGADLFLTPFRRQRKVDEFLYLAA